MDKAIQLLDVRRQYHLGSTDVNALENINLEIDQGEFVALVGPSGSGKSTLLHLLGGLDRPTSGEIYVRGLSLHTANEEELTGHRRHNTGFIFQTFNLLPTLTALENVTLPLMLGGVGIAERNQRSTQLLERVGLGDRLHHRPTELSGGEQQRAAIARALVNEPQLILADEPTGNLDSSTGADVMNLLRELNSERGVTLIVVTHDAEVAAYADRIVHLRDGQISQIETTKATPDQAELPAPAETPSNGGLSFRDLLRTSLSNLRRRPVRNVLTSAGVVIGIVTLVAMVSVGVGVQAEINRNFQALGLENVFVSPAFPEEEDAFDPFGFAEPKAPLTPDIAVAFRELPEVDSVTPVLSLPSNLEVSLTFDDQTLPLRLAGDFGRGPQGPGNLTPPEMLAGEPLGEGDTESMVLLTDLADQLLSESGGDYADLIGQMVTLTVRLPRGETRDFTTTIIGVEDDRSFYSADIGLQERTEIKIWWFGRPDTLNTDGYDMLVVRAVNQSAVPAVLDVAEGLGLEAQSLGAVLEIANRVLAVMQALLGSVGGLALLVATLGVANTMMMAIYERTREIGVLKALGARNKEVRRMFTADAVLLGFIGGVVGLILGTLLGRLVDWIGHLYLANEGVTGIGPISIVPPWLAIGSLVFAAFIGVLGGFYPATRAARLDPVVALKHE
ncbi:MAG: ATP-binding cassette domain-containing protein [Chloroflexi bacterium]|nr:MAG: ATP-binding cassette domain-containing protein [Chloroflexota bacterium]MBL1194284.1 ATP-binding cassette domain-containing protein [Chloroflexota bacterium]NOH11574.1 ATP-binding cassette domain-containing protein [Chloroflexota bacterium]